MPISFFPYLNLYSNYLSWAEIDKNGTAKKRKSNIRDVILFYTSLILCVLFSSAWSVLLGYYHIYTWQNATEQNYKWIHLATDCIKIPILINYFLILCILLLSHHKLYPLLHSIKKPRFKIVCIIILLFVTILCLIPFVSWTISDKFDWYHRHSIIPQSNIVCDKYLICKYFSIWDVTHYFIYFITTPLIIIIIFITYFHFITDRWQSVDINDSHKRTLSLVDNQFICFTNNDQMVHGNVTVNDAASIESRKTTQQSEYSETKSWFIIISFLLVFGFMWMLMDVYLSPNLSIPDDYYEEYYLGFLCLVTVYKSLMKRLGQIVDQMRIYRDPNHAYCISIEYMFEWIISVFYFTEVRFLFIFNTPTTPTFCRTISIHLVSEVFQSRIRFTTIYYYGTKKLIDKIIDKYPSLEETFVDDSSLKEWFNRMSMDFVARYYTSVVTGVSMLVYLWLIGEHNVEKHYYVSSYGRVMVYTFISVIVDVLYHWIVFTINVYWNDYNSLSEWNMYFESLNKTQVFLFFSCWISIYLVFYFNFI